MSEVEQRLAGLRLGLKFAGAARRPAIEAMIAALVSQQQDAPGAFARESAEAEPALQPSTSGAGMDVAAAPLSEAGDDPDEAGNVTGQPLDWREVRRALREAGHEVKQLDGVVYVDGRRSNDPALVPA